MKKNIFVFLSAACVAGCASFGVEPGREKVTAEILPAIEVDSSKALPHIPPQVAKSFGQAYSAPALERKLASILARLRVAGQRPSQRYTAAILNSPTVNAFALPDGQIFITRGLLALMNDEAELAAVLSHEMAHVEARHTAERMEQAKTALLASRVMAEVAKDQSAAKQSLMAGALTLSNFSRQQELQADALGIRTMARAGYDPYGAVRILENMERYDALQKLDRDTAQSPTANFYASHPATPQRIASALSAARQISGPGIGEADRKTFLPLLDKLMMDDDPTQGLIRANKFIHPALGFSFVAPEGFKLENSSRSIQGISKQGQALRFDKISTKSGTNLEDILRESASQDLSISAIEPLKINGLAAATAIGRSAGWHFRFVVIQFHQEVYRFIFVTKQLTQDLDAAYLASAKSFRKLESAERTQVKPYHLHIFSVSEHDTIEQLAAQMAGDEPKLERFLILNGLDRTSQLYVGQQLKLVVED